MAPSIVIDGSVVRSYRPAYIEHGRVLAPIQPYVLAVSASVEYAGGSIIVRRGDRFAEIPNTPFVAIAPLLRTLGVRVSYDAAAHRVTIETPPAVLATPTPFNPAVPRFGPREVFTPSPAPTPRPIVTGKPSPRRTPLPAEATPR